ncbi:MAG: CheY-like chemotaxis protein [Flavobacteriales bacterium]|jgi:CheY-like chemotaxis protein|tara:strand:- start:1533 stop:1931 length:399 start_codon:yes stop_codon:yes gene_type:complete
MKELHILLVEDNEGDVILTLDAFEESEIKTKISVAKNGKDALDFLFKRESFKDVEKPDLVLLDLNIPIFSGMEVLKEVRQHPILKKMPIIILTTSSNPIEINKANEYQANNFVTKPIDMTEILKTILSLEEF